MNSSGKFKRGTMPSSFRETSKPKSEKNKRKENYSLIRFNHRCNTRNKVLPD
jgi:hypothetical protein